MEKVGLGLGCLISQALLNEVGSNNSIIAIFSYKFNPILKESKQPKICNVFRIGPNCPPFIILCESLLKGSQLTHTSHNALFQPISYGQLAGLLPFYHSFGVYLSYHMPSFDHGSLIIGATILQSPSIIDCCRLLSSTPAS
jgi:hypothetical protein